MADLPYRTAPAAGSVPREPSDSERLGPLESTCAPLPLARALAPGLVLLVPLLLVGGGLAATAGPLVFVVTLPFAVLAFLLVAWSPLRRRRLRVELHAGGLVVSWGEKREVVLFDDVDEVWMTIDVLRSSVGSIALVPALRLVLHDRSHRRVPTNLKGGDRIVRAVLLHCSHPLQAQASAALKAGETLTFGPLRIDRTSLRSRAWAMRWEEVSLVRCAPGRLHLFRRQRVIPWRTIHLDSVPHPTVFTRLVMQCARKVETDDSFSALTT